MLREPLALWDSGRMQTNVAINQRVICMAGRRYGCVAVVREKSACGRRALVEFGDCSREWHYIFDLDTPV